MTSYLEEMLFKRLHFHYAFFLVGFMCLMYSALYLLYTFTVAGLKKSHPGPRTKVLAVARERGLSQSLFWLCVAYAGSNSVSKLALDYVSIPTQIVFKSCKLVAVMIGSTFILKRTYSLFEYAIACGLVIGMACFAAADLKGEAAAAEASHARMLFGLVLLVGSLFCDSVLGNLQELVQKGNVCHETELMYVQSLFSGLVLFVWTALSGELSASVALCVTSPTVVVCVIVWSLANMMGVVLLLKVAGEFSAVTAVLTAFIRKFFSLLVSYIVFPKPLTWSHFAGLVFVFSSVGAHAWQKLKKKSQNSPHLQPADMRKVNELERIENGVAEPQSNLYTHLNRDPDQYSAGSNGRSGLNPVRSPVLSPNKHAR